MREEQVWAAIALTFVLGVLVVIARVAGDWRKAATARREMAHRERLAALERGVAPPEVPELWSDPEARVDPATLRLFALAVGLMLLGGGLGGGVGCALLPAADETRQLAPLALVPSLVGIGLLLFHRLTRS